MYQPDIMPCQRSAISSCYSNYTDMYFFTIVRERSAPFDMLPSLANICKTIISLEVIGINLQLTDSTLWSYNSGWIFRENNELTYLPECSGNIQRSPLVFSSNYSVGRNVLSLDQNLEDILMKKGKILLDISPMPTGRWFPIGLLSGY